MWYVGRVSEEEVEKVSGIKGKSHRASYIGLAIDFGLWTLFYKQRGFVEGL